MKDYPFQWKEVEQHFLETPNSDAYINLQALNWSSLHQPTFQKYN